MQLTSEQVRRLGDNQRVKFERRVLAHVQEFFSLECTELGEDRCRSAIAACVASCARFGMTRECDVCQYVDLSFAFRSVLEKLPWASEILARPDVDGPGKAALLYAHALREAPISLKAPP